MSPSVGVALAIGYFVDSTLPANNGFLQLTVFLAFAVLYPDFQLLLFFLLPVKIKWLAILTWILFFFSFISGSWLDRLVIAGSVVNYFLFFGQDIYLRPQGGAAKCGTEGQQGGQRKARLSPLRKMWNHRSKPPQDALSLPRRGRRSSLLLRRLPEPAATSGPGRRVVPATYN